ncbi:MAG: hypothetical protein RLZZ196_105 [Bacteroidota bacterium]|jgi:hypothetical protein
MTHPVPPSDIQKTELDMEVILSEEDRTIYVKLSGFETNDDAEQYSVYLQENLPLLLFESEVKH